jgi:Ca2+-binding EF-hand superfamily protein
MKESLCLVAVLALAGCSTTAPDRDKQAKVSYNEFVETMRVRGVDGTDKNRDGAISWEEWQQLDVTPEARQHFNSLDSDNDGKISRTEWKTGLEKNGISMGLFKRLDVNEDGYLGPSELRKQPVSGLFSIGF